MGLLLVLSVGLWIYASRTHGRHVRGYGRTFLAKPQAVALLSLATGLTAVAAFVLALLSAR